MSVRLRSFSSRNATESNHRLAIRLLGILVTAAVVLTWIIVRQHNEAVALHEHLLLSEAQRHIAADEWPQALTLMGHLISSGSPGPRRDAAHTIFAYRAHQLVSYREAALSLPTPGVVNWAGHAYVVYEPGKLADAGETDVDYWSYVAETQVLLTLANPHTDNGLAGFRVDAGGVERLGSVSDLYNYGIGDVVRTVSASIFIIEISATVHHSTLFGYEPGHVIANLANNKLGTIDGKLCSAALSADRRFVRIEPCWSDPGRIYDVLTKPAHEDGTPYWNLLPTDFPVETQWASIDGQGIGFSAVPELAFPAASSEREYSLWSAQSCELHDVAWKLVDIEREHDESMPSVPWESQAEFSHNDLALDLYMDFSGACGRHFSAGGMWLGDCIYGAGPVRFSAQADLALIAYDPTRRVVSFSVADLDSQLNMTADRGVTGEVLPDYAAVSADHKRVAVVSNTRELSLFEVLSEDECRAREHDYWGPGWDCLILESRFQVEDELEKLEAPYLSAEEREQARLDAMVRAITGERDPEQAIYYPDTDKLHLVGDMVIVIGRDGIAARAADDGRRVWKKNHPGARQGFVASSLSPSRRALAVSNGERLDVVSVDTGTSLTGELDIERLLRARPSAGTALCPRIRAAFAREVIRIPPTLADPVAHLFWLPDDRLGVYHDGRLAVRARPSVDAALLAELSSYSGYRFDSELVKIKRLPLSTDD